MCIPLAAFCSIFSSYFWSKQSEQIGGSYAGQPRRTIQTSAVTPLTSVKAPCSKEPCWSLERSGSDWQGGPPAALPCHPQAVTYSHCQLQPTGSMCKWGRPWTILWGLGTKDSEKSHHQSSVRGKTVAFVRGGQHFDGRMNKKSLLRRQSKPRSPQFTGLLRF